MSFSAILAALLFALSVTASAQKPNPKVESGKFVVELRIPEGGVYAGEEIDIEFRVGDKTKDDPILGPAGVANVDAKATVTMPSMPGMPVQRPKIHKEGVPGDYGIECFFPHGGEYKIELALTPKGEPPFKAVFLVDVKDAEARSGKPRPLPYRLELQGLKPGAAAGEKLSLRLAVKDAKTGKIVKDFDIAHEKRFHLIIVSKDLGWFVHEHPEQGPDGVWTIDWTFPAGGEYLIYGDVAPAGRGSQVISTSMKLAGAKGAWPPKLAAGPLVSESEGLRVKLDPQEKPIPIGTSTTLRFTITTTDGKPITDLEPYLGAFGHLMVIHQDGKTFVHSHPAEDEASMAMNKKGIADFTARFPRKGLYKAWAQFQRGGKVLTFPFVFEVKEEAEVFAETGSCCSGEMTTLAHLTALVHDEDAPKKPSKAAGILKKASDALEKYKSGLSGDGKYSCCVKAPPGREVSGCDLCAIRNGSCNCAANLATGKGACGECKGHWNAGNGAFPNLKAEDVKVLPAEQQKVEGASQNVEDPNLKQYRELMLQAKKVLVEEKRFGCCVGQGGCHECALEQYCPCAKNLASDIENAGKPGYKPKGICGQCLDGQHAGHGRIEGADPQHIHATSGQHDMEGMAGLLGRWGMGREGSGTSWLPESSPMHMLMLGEHGGFDLNLMGLQTVNWTDQGGPRGESQFFSNSMWMLMGRKEVGSGILGLRLMMSTDAIFNGEEGYPLLFQTGETANGQPLKDRQHPHDFVSELAASWSQPISERSDLFLYGGLVGEPALANSMYLHRPSAWDNPETPIGHHWYDSTHISFGVLTAGISFDGTWKLEGSLFNGHEPDEDRFGFDPIELNSASARLTYSPDPNWTLSAGYGFLDEPEALEPGVHQNRLAASAHYNRPMGEDGNFAAALIYGRNIKRGEEATDAWLLEAAQRRRDLTIFGRIERVEKDELVNVPPGIYTINKFSIGATHEFLRRSGFEYGAGFVLSAYSFPSSLEPFYGSGPVSIGLFVRIRPERMKH